MCGIVGRYGLPLPGSFARALVRRMLAAVAHRGPDGDGILVAGRAALGHARLSIIDLEGGAQPMSDELGGVSITFNGEIFNYVELRRDLIARGVRFRTQSDTEVILRLYEQKGEACVEDLNGDFAFAIHDKRRERLVLARDRMGVRPLYYARTKDGLLFGSEIKALLAAGVDAAADPIALDQIFTVWSPLPPRTAFANVNELPPGYILIATSEGVSTRPYWRLQYPRAGEESEAADEPALARELQALLVDATRIRLRADVPVGAYLSGGLDSAIVATLARDMVGRRLTTFSVTFDNPEFDESEHQLRMVAELGAEHRSVACTSAAIGAEFPDVVAHMERPVLRTAPGPLFALSRLARDSGCKVVLTGEGADEVFAGYDIFKEAKVRAFCARQPNSAFRPLLFRRLYPYLPGIQAQNPAYLKAFFGQSLDRLGDPLFSHLPRFETTGRLKALFSGDLKATLAGYDALGELRESLPADFPRWHPLHRAQYLESAYLLPGYILSAQGDRVAMAHAVEGRFPFLDHRVVECAARIPPRLKLKGLREKHILRESMAGRLPPEIGGRVKQPYRAPDAASFTGSDAPAYVGELLTRANVARGGVFDPRAVERLGRKVAEHGAASFRDNMALVGIISTGLWHRRFLADGWADASPEALSA